MTAILAAVVTTGLITMIYIAIISDHVGAPSHEQ